MSRFLYGIGPTEPAAYGAAIVLLAGTSLVAVMVPARRAARVDPLVALQTD